MGFIHDVETIIEAARVLKGSKDIIFLFIGGGAKKEKLQTMVQKYQLRNVVFLPYQPRTMLGITLTCSDVSIVALQSEILGLSVPSKFYGILASARPVIALVPANSEVALAVNESECGFVIEPKDVSKLVNCIQLLYKDRKKCKKFSTNARNCFDKNYTRAKIVERYVKLIQEVSV